MQKIIPHLWFDKNAEEAAAFYASTFGGGRVLGTTRYTEAGKEVHGMEAGTAMTVEFEIEGYKMIALNGGPHFKFTPAISFMVACSSEEEVERLWEKLSAGGTALMPLDKYFFSEKYGWVQDRFGLSWQVSLALHPSLAKITPSLMYVGEQAGRAEEAIRFYASIFPNSSVGELARYGADHTPDKEGSLMFGAFTLAGQAFAAMDSAHAHQFSFTEAISLLVLCESQEEIDAFWQKLSSVPESEQCGWLKDKFGVSWQIVPKGMKEMLNDPDKDKAERAMKAMLKMKKLDIAKLKEAYAG